MLFWMRGRRAVALALTALTIGGLMAGPITARADDDKGKKGDKKGGDIIIGPSTIVHDPPNGPKKKGH